MKQHSNLFIFDATPLIYLAKTDVLEKILLLQTKNVILESVYQEVVAIGNKKGHNDALIIQKLIDKRIFIITKCIEKAATFKNNKNLSSTDNDVLTYAKGNNGILIADDEEVRTVAEIENIEVHGSIYILFRLLYKKSIDKKTLKYVLDKMIDEGWYCSIDFYKEIMNALNTVE